MSGIIGAGGARSGIIGAGGGGASDGEVIGSGFQRFTSGDVYNQTSTFVTPVDYLSISCEVGDTIYFGFMGSAKIEYITGTGSSYTVRYAPYSLWHNTASASAGASNTGTQIQEFNQGVSIVASSGEVTYNGFNISGAFETSATTHYIGVGYKTNDTGVRHTMFINSTVCLFVYYFIIKGDRVL